MNKPVMRRHLNLLRDLCQPHATLNMVRRANNYRYAVLVVAGERFPDKRLGYDVLLAWQTKQWLTRKVASIECYEITPEGRAIVLADDEPEPPFSMATFLQAQALARKALGR